MHKALFFAINRVLDLQNRRASFAESVPSEVMTEVLAKLMTLLES